MNSNTARCRITANANGFNQQLSAENRLSDISKFSYNLNHQQQYCWRMTNKSPTTSRRASPIFSSDGSTLTYSSSNEEFVTANSTPSLTPSASPSSNSSSLRKSGPAPPPPPPSSAPSKPTSAPPPPPPQNAKPKHPSAKPPPPPAAAGSVMRTRSFNQGRGSSACLEDEDTPAPPTRTISNQQQQQSYSSQTMPHRRGPQSRPSIAQSPHLRPAPMKPPSAPPPPPPSAPPPKPPHRAQPAPPPPSMQSPYAKPSHMMSSSPRQSMSSGSNPPTPPTRRHSLRANNNAGSGGETFESRFSHMFKSPQYLPPPEPFTQCAKTYPSRNQFSGRQGSMMKRAPAPPPPPASQPIRG